MVILVLIENNVMACTSLVFSMNANLTIDSTHNPGGNPEIIPNDEQHVRRQLKAGEHVLAKVIKEKNTLQDANTRLDIELKDVRAQLADSVKENKRLRRDIFSKCLNELLKEFSDEAD